jgi:dienelactone hydrolase
MVLTVELPAATERRLAERAARAGTTAAALVLDLIERELAPAKEPTVAEIMAPFAKEFADSGMTEEQLDALVEEARQEAWDAKRGPKS